MKHRWKLTLSYEGTEYCGWQVQPNGMTVQEKVHFYLEKILQEKISLVGSGRTDAGVHALGQVAHFYTQKHFDAKQILFSLNRLLPKDIAALDLLEVPQSFHAQRSAITKTYLYYIHAHNYENPFYRRFSWHTRYRLDFTKMEEGAKIFLGTHDFRSFANESYAGACAKNPIRTITESTWEQQGPFWVFRITGNGFFYKMVRNIVGTLVDLGRGKISLQNLEEILRAYDRSAASPAAPAHGLFLQSVYYKDFKSVSTPAPLQLLQEMYKNRN